MTVLAGKRCLITGAASGIGRATAVAVAARGGELVLTDVDAQGLAAVVGQIRDGGGVVCMHAALDLRDLAAVRGFAADVHAAHGSVDVVMNIAGVAIWGAVENLRAEDWQRAIDVNLMGPIHVIESFLPAMISAGRGGHLVNVSSAAGLLGLPWHAAYSASKFGQRGICEVLRFELAHHPIRVSLVCPGGVDTPIVDRVHISGVDMSSPAVQRLRDRFRARAISPERAAAAIVRGVERDQYMVFTSLDIRVGHWFARVFPWPYELAMRRLNRLFRQASSQ